MKTVCILGMAPTTRDLVMEEPEGPEIWGLNQAHIYYPPEQLARFTRWFQIHPWDEMVMVQRPEHHHLDFLATCPVPVFLHEERTEVPLGVRYPIEEVRANLGRDYLTGGPSYMLALAIYEGFHRIKIYGMDMANSTEYFEQRPCFEWLIGVAEGRGIEVWLPEGSSIMRGAGYARAYGKAPFRPPADLLPQGAGFIAGGLRKHQPELRAVCVADDISGSGLFL